MSRRSLVWLAVVAGVAFWLWTSEKVAEVGSSGPGPSAGAGESAGAAGSAGTACLAAAEEANRLSQEAATVLLRGPVDPGAFSAASESASTAISSAEDACGGGGSEREQKAMEEARGALAEMRALLAGLGGALSGSGSASDAPTRTEAIDRRMNAARAALRG